MKVMLWLVRIIVGALFIFSGLVKANDPLGLSYKMNEFFEVLHMTWMAPYSLALSVTMIAFEIIAGVAVLIGAAFRVFSFLLLLLILFFTFLTGYIYYWDVIMHAPKIRECGCFGACIPMSNTETFWKDVALLVLCIILFVFRKRVRPVFSGYPTAAIMILTTFFSFGIQWWVLEHLPFVDCMPASPGNHLLQQTRLPEGAEPPVYETMLVYEKDGKRQEFTMQNYPWQDTAWVFVEQKTKLIKEGTAEAALKDFTIKDPATQTDYTEQVLSEPGYTLLLFIRDPADARTDNMERIQKLAAGAVQHNIPFYALVSGTDSANAQFQRQWKLESVPFYTLDGTASKTAMRSNPGLMLLENGVIREKWSFRDYPKGIRMQNGKPEFE